MNANIANLIYLVSGVLFILALRGLSHPVTSRQGNVYGMVGMAIAIVTTLALSPPSGFGWGLVLVGLAAGGAVGTYRARTIAMTEMPQLVAFFHALVGLAAVFVAAGALYAPQAFGLGTPGGDLLVIFHEAYLYGVEHLIELTQQAELGIRGQFGHVRHTQRGFGHRVAEERRRFQTLRR